MNSRIVVLEEGGFIGLVASCLETLDKEAGGFLIGKNDVRFVNGRRTKCLAIDAAYPVQTAKRTSYTWEPLDWNAYDRIIDSIDAMKFNIVGEYHSHPYDEPKLSRKDMGYIKGELREFAKREISLDKWLEIVAQTMKPSRRERRVLRSHCYCKNLDDGKVECIFWSRSRKYKLVIAGYWIEPETFEEKEAMIHIR